MKKIISIIFLLSVPLFLVTQISLAKDLRLAPCFDLQDMSKTKISLSSYKDKQQVLLFFWTTWCPFCRKELKVLNNRCQELVKNGWEILSIDVGEPEEKIEKFLKSQNLVLGFKVLLDKDTSIANSYEVLGVPTFVFVNKKGQVIFKDNVFPENYKNFSSK